MLKLWRMLTLLTLQMQVWPYTWYGKRTWGNINNTDIRSRCIDVLFNLGMPEIICLQRWYFHDRLEGSGSTNSKGTTFEIIFKL